MDAHRLRDASLELDRYLPRIAVRSGRSARDGLVFAGTDLLVMAVALVAGRLGLLVSSQRQPGEALLGLLDSPDALRIGQVYALLMLALIFAFRRLGHYNRRRPFWQELGDVLSLSLGAAVLHMAFVFLLKANVSRAWMLTTWGLVAVGVPLTRVLLKRWLLARGRWVRPTVIVGTGRNARDAAVALTSDPLLGYRVDAFLAPECGAPLGGVPDQITVTGRPRPVLPLDPEIGLLPPDLGRPHVTIALELDEMARCGALIEKLNLYYGDVDVVSPLRGVPLSGTKVTHFFGHDILALRLYNTLSRPWPQLIKRLFDLVAGSLLLLAALPLMAVIALRVRADGGPVFYGHSRVGMGGRPFRCYKFRTMVPAADRLLAEVLARDAEARAAWERDQKLRDDPRVTAFGTWLRKTSLDELPQLWNVVRGDMSLVGPRPITPAELSRYDETAVYYVETRPGLTGLWQISGRNDLDYDRRVHLDAWYVKNWNLWYDLVILAQTAWVVLRRQGAY